VSLLFRLELRHNSGIGASDESPTVCRLFLLLIRHVASAAFALVKSASSSSVNSSSSVLDSSSLGVRLRLLKKVGLVVSNAREMLCFLPRLPLYRRRFFASRWGLAPNLGAGLFLGIEIVRCIQQKMTKTCTSCSTLQTPGSRFAALRATDVGVMVAVLVSCRCWLSALPFLRL
jgi:hypothetical protein